MMSSPPIQPNFSLATEHHREGLARLLSNNAMEGKIRIILAQDPLRFSGVGTVPGVLRQTVAAHLGDDLVCAGFGEVRNCFVNGHSHPLGYLGGLRLDPKHAGRYDMLRRGYRYFRDLKWPENPVAFITSIAADNCRAIRFLERGLPGMPHYRFLGDWWTFVVPLPRREGARARALRLPEKFVRATGLTRTTVGRDQWDGLADFLNRTGARRQFAPAWGPEALQDLEQEGLAAGDYVVLRSDGGIRGCAALWDQRKFKQIGVAGYAPPWSWTRPLVNLCAKVAGYPGLPVAGDNLSCGFVTHLRTLVEDVDLSEALLRAVYELAFAKGIDFLFFGFDPRDEAMKACASRFVAKRYGTKIYSVEWEGKKVEVDGRLLGLEGALL